jgi:hypothetical protein
MVSFAAPLANAEILQYQCECSGLLVRLRPKQAASWCGRAVEGGGCGAEKDEGVAALNSTTPWVTGRARGEGGRPAVPPTRQAPIRSKAGWPGPARPRTTDIVREDRAGNDSCAS